MKSAVAAGPVAPRGKRRPDDSRNPPVQGEFAENEGREVTRLQGVAPADPCSIQARVELGLLIRVSITLEVPRKRLLSDDGDTVIASLCSFPA